MDARMDCGDRLKYLPSMVEIFGIYSGRVAINIEGWAQ